MEGTIKMKTIVLSVLFLAVLAVSILFLGCEEQDLVSKRRTRLVGDENLRLKKQLKVCNLEIQKLEEVIAKYEKEEEKRFAQEQKTSSLAVDWFKGMNNATKKIEKLTDENLRLKTRIAELESELAQSADLPDAQ